MTNRQSLQRAGLSSRACSLWAKSDYGVGEQWLPLFVHLHDTMGVIGRLWDEWLPSGTRDIVCRAFAGRVSRPMELARACVLFLGAVHDVGKATPVFQAGIARLGQDAEEADLSWRPRKAGLPLVHGSDEIIWRQVLSIGIYRVCLYVLTVSILWKIIDYDAFPHTYTVNGGLWSAGNYKAVMNCLVRTRL